MTYLDEKAETERLLLEAVTLADREAYIFRCRTVSAWIEHGYISSQQREKMLETLRDKERLL